jgi:hypothetical protein
MNDYIFGYCSYDVYTEKIEKIANKMNPNEFMEIYKFVATQYKNNMCELIVKLEKK